MIFSDSGLPWQKTHAAKETEGLPLLREGIGGGVSYIDFEVHFSAIS